MTHPVLLEQRGSIVTLTLNRPELRNPITEPDMVSALIGALARIDAARDVKVAILTGAGSAFSSGGNIRAMADRLEARAARPLLTQDYYKSGVQLIPRAFQQLDIPIIAAVNGPAIGAGCDLACMCDIRIAAESARFAESFVKLGIIAGDGGAWLLPRLVGYSKAAELALTGDPIGAREALACGLVSSVVPDGELLPAANMLAERIAVNPRDSVRMTKRLMTQGREMSLDASLTMAAAFQSLAHSEPDHQEAVTAFMEKRAAKFS